MAVVIVGFRNADDVLACLNALDRQSCPAFQVVICENGGADAFVALKKRAPSRLSGGQSVTIFDAGSNLGFAGGVNAGIRAAPDVDAWWVLNPDAQPEPEALAALTSRLERGDCEAVGGVLVFPDGRVQGYGGRWSAALGRPSSIGYGAPADRPVDGGWVEARQNYLNGACMLVGRAFLERAGFMREDYFLYCEEVEWCLRARRLGLRLGFAPGARVIHAQGTTTGASGTARDRSRLAVYLDERNKVLLTRDLYPAGLLVAPLATLALMMKRYLLTGAWRQFGYGFAGWMAGLVGRRGPPPFATGR